LEGDTDSMKNSITHIIIIVVAIILTSILGAKLYKQQEMLFPGKDAMRAVPIAGLHKFTADVSWMLFVNYLGSISGVNEKNVDEVTNRLEKLIRLDPNQPKYYENGAMFLSNEDAPKTLEILQKGTHNPNLKNNSVIPFNAGFIFMHNLDPPDYVQAANYFNTSLNRPVDSEYSISTNAKQCYFRCLALKDAIGKKIDFRIAMVEVLYKEIESDRNNENSENCYSAEQPDIKEKLLNALRNAKIESENYTPTKNALQRIKEISTKVFANDHICDKCMQQYGPGQNYCSHCGNKLVPWGVCPKCGAVIGCAKFCPKCGTKAEE